MNTYYGFWEYDEFQEYDGLHKYYGYSQLTARLPNIGRNFLGDVDAIFLRLVCEHGPRNAVADGVDLTDVIIENFRGIFFFKKISRKFPLRNLL
jgi:hypothetical protein